MLLLSKMFMPFFTVNTLLGSLFRPFPFMKVYQPLRFLPLNKCIADFGL